MVNVFPVPCKVTLPFIVSVRHVAAAATGTVTVAPEAIVTSSLAPGITPPTHVLPTFQAPPAPVELIAAAKIFVVRRTRGMKISRKYFARESTLGAHPLKAKFSIA
jgi:hypothetical protein